MTNNLSSQTVEFESDMAHFIVHRKPKCSVEVQVKPKELLLEKSREEAKKIVCKGARIPGFRKGHATISLVEKHYPEEIKKETERTAIRQSFTSYKTLLGAPLPLDEKEIRGSFSENGIFLYFETYPIVPSVDPTLFSLQPITRPKVEEEQIQETIRQALMFLATWSEVTDRSVQENDFVTLNLETLETDPPSTVFSGTRFEVTDKSMAQWMKQLILGKKKDDVIEGMSDVDADATEEEKKMLPPRKVRVTICSIDQVVLPELDASTLKIMGVDSEETLKQRVQDKLNKDADAHVQESQKNQVLDFLATYAFDIPETWTSNELKFRLNQLSQDKSFMDHWKTLNETGRKETLAFLASQAEKSIRIYNLCQRFLAEKNISISSAALESNTNNDPDFHPQAAKAEAMSRLILSKVTDYIISQTKQTANT